MVHSSVAIRRRDGLRDSCDGSRLRRKLVPRQRCGRVAADGARTRKGPARRKVRQDREGISKSRDVAVAGYSERTTDPLRRARELQRSWERLLADGALVGELPPGATAGLRSTIVDSWQRSLARGLDPTDVLAPIRRTTSEVLGAGSSIHSGRWPTSSPSDSSGWPRSRGIVVVTDASGLILHRVGDEGLKERAAEMISSRARATTRRRTARTASALRWPQTAPSRCSPSSTSTSVITSGSARALRCTIRCPARQSD